MGPYKRLIHDYNLSEQKKALVNNFWVQEFMPLPPNSSIMNAVG